MTNKILFVTINSIYFNRADNFIVNIFFVQLLKYLKFGDLTTYLYCI